MDPENAAMKMYEAQADLILVRDELEKVKRERDELQRLLKNKDPLGSGSNSSRNSLGLENKVEEMQKALAKLSTKFEKFSVDNKRNMEEMKKKIDFISRQPKFDKQASNNFNNEPRKGENKPYENTRQENFNPERHPRQNFTDMLLMLRDRDTWDQPQSSALSSDLVYMFDYTNNLWNTFTLHQQGIEKPKAIVHLNNEIYFLKVTHLRQVGMLRWRDYFYKLATDFTWKELSTSNYRRANISRSTVVYDNCIWVIGGSIDELDLNGKMTGKPTNIVEKYDPIKDCWMEMPSLNAPRESASAIVIRQKLYVCGGKNADKKVECFDPISNMWINICTLPAYRHNLAIVPSGNNFVILGGGGHAGQRYADVWKIVVDTDPVKCVGMTPLPKARRDFSAIGLGNTIVAIGGYMDTKVRGQISESVTNSVAIFNGKYWKEGPPMPGPRAEYLSVVIPQELGNKLVNKFG